jgi:hypothetical protein
MTNWQMNNRQWRPAEVKMFDKFLSKYPHNRRIWQVRFVSGARAFCFVIFDLKTQAVAVRLKHSDTLKAALK